MATSTTPTHLLFQHDATLHTHTTALLAVLPFPALSPANRALFKPGTDASHALVTASTIFHPQGGGQPSDTGALTLPSGATFAVAHVRMDADVAGRVLHFGAFASPSDAEAAKAAEGQEVTQAIDAAQRALFSRYHTAGHVLGAAVRHLLEAEVPGFDELKASHFPDAASCEFAGLIAGGWKEEIQRKVNAYVDADMAVEIEWWGEEEFAAQGLQRLVPDPGVFAAAEGGRLRVVRIVGAEVYPCGGTHVESTRGCGKTTVRKISRQKGMSRVSYALAA